MTTIPKKPQSFPIIIEGSVNPELSKWEKPTSPSLLVPGTEEAVRRQCICPVEQNILRLAAGERLVLDKNCRVHNKVCQAEKCEHGEHTGPQVHFRCEHCTNVLHECVVCGAVYLEDGDDPTLSGWKFQGSDSNIIKGWRCWRCK